MWGVLALSALGCGAVYPEVRTPVRPVPAGQELKPPPPADVLYIAFAGAVIPEKTRDGRSWDAVGGSAPDPFAKLMANDRELFRTPIQSNTLTPTWPDAPKENWRIAKGTTLRVELWDSNPINNHPICVRTIRDPHAQAGAGELDIDCDSGAKLRLVIAPGRAKLGVGFSYELRTESVFVSRVVAASPAGRAGLTPGDRIVRIQGQDVKGLDEGEIRSLINANAPSSLALSVRHADGGSVEMVLKEGPMYPTRSDDVPLED